MAKAFECYYCNLELGNHFIFVQVEIEATVAGWRGDIAIDELRFTPGLCPIRPIGDVAAGTIPTPPVPTTALIPMAPPYSKKLFLSKHIRKIVYHNQFIPKVDPIYPCSLVCLG